MWFKRYAKKIDNLPILNVDNQLLDYGVFVSDSLRQSETAMKGIGAKSGMASRSWGTTTAHESYGVAGGRTADWGNAYGAYRWSTQEDLAAKGQAEAQVRTQERISGNANAHFIMQGIDQATSAIRRTMTQKYKMEF